MDCWYECNFSGDMPELNFDNPEVRAAALDVAKHYLDMGVDGFRFDAVKYIYFGDTAASVAFWEWYMDELRAIDPEAAARLHLKDEKRILRALEVWQETGKTITQHNRETQAVPPRYEAVYIGLDFENRDDLRARIDRRVDIMVEKGLLQEVRDLLSSGIPRTATALQAIGYKQFLAVEEGRATEEEAVEEVKLRSRQYAKRQLTWLRRNEAIHWLRWGKEPNFQEALQKATEILTALGLS